MWSLLDYFPEDFKINILDIGAALNERPPYQSLVDAGRARILGFEPNREECERLNQCYGEPHRFFPYFVGDGRSAIFHETNWVLTGSLYEPNSPLLEKFQNLAELVTPVGKHPVALPDLTTSMRSPMSTLSRLTSREVSWLSSRTDCARFPARS
jgi:hypothetical protein